jgi:adenine specific DNA methylase Mod
MKITFAKDKHIPLKEYVWYKEVCIGYISSRVIEKKDIDWQKYRADKTLKMTPGERWYIEYYPVAFPNSRCKKCLSKDESAKLILMKHKERYLLTGQG